MEDRPLWQRSQQLASQGHLAQAIAQALGIAPGRALYGEAQAAISTWKGQLKRQQLARQWAGQARLARSPVQPQPAPLPPTPVIPPAPALPQVSATASGPILLPGLLFFEGKPPLPIPRPSGSRQAPESTPPPQGSKAPTAPTPPTVSSFPQPELVQPRR
ncbi:MAG: hypothetical protein LVS60_18900 [Nodosilinea sp. LVE1205-7]|jgi:hypothetical protein